MFVLQTELKLDLVFGCLYDSNIIDSNICYNKDYNYYVFKKFGGYYKFLGYYDFRSKCLLIDYIYHVFDIDGKLIKRYDSNGHWIKYEYCDGNLVKEYCSIGDWRKYEYDDIIVVTYENSYGEFIKLFR